MDEEERISRFCTAYAMAQRVLDMAAEQPVHTGMARDEARRQLAIALELFPAPVKAKIARLNKVAAKIQFPRVVASAQSRTTGPLIGK
jgi:hypothetical protein